MPLSRQPVSRHVSRVAAITLAAALAASACGGAESSQTTAALATTSATADQEGHLFVGADGVESTITDTSRIVTLSGDLTETVWALGLGESVVATDVTTVYPPEATQLPIIGVGRFLNAEAVLAQSPTLVLGDTQTSPPGAIEQIRSAGVPVVIVEVPVTFEGLYDKIGSVATALGVAEAGVALADRVKADVETVLAGAGDLGTEPAIAFVYSRGPDVMLLFGAEMTTQPLIEAAGGIDVGAASGVSGTVSVTPEALIAASPDVIVTTSEGLDALGGVDGMLAIPGFAETPAGAAGQILDYPEGDFLTFGPRIAESLDRLIADLHALSASQ